MKQARLALGALLGAAFATACGDDGADRPPPAGDVEGLSPALLPVGPSELFAISSIVSSADDTASYVSLVGTLDGATIDYGESREFPGQADLWSYDGSLFVSDFDSLTITKFSVESGALVETGKVSFQAYGLTDFGFWLNSFISSTKAYFLNGASEIIIWNPSDMSIMGSVPLPQLESRGTLAPFPGYSDRAAVVRDNLWYQPFYWADDTFFEFTPDSSIAVFDTQTDRLVNRIEAPCPGLDFATRDEAGNLYFSSWVFAPSGAALLEQPATCVAKVAAGGSTATSLFALSDVTEGREGGAFRYVGSGRALLSVLHEEHSDATDIEAVAYGPNWRFWSYDLATNQAKFVDGLDWNAGAAYSASTNDRELLLVPSGDYSDTGVYDISDPASPKHLLDTRGWSLRLFQVQ